MDGIVNWRTFEKMTNWAVSKSDEDARRWDAGADGWQKRIDFEKKFSQAQVDALTRITKRCVEETDTKHVDPLFSGHEDYQEFVERHKKDAIKKKDIRKAKGKVFLGIDAGSTTTKAALIDDEKNLLYSFYRNNEGKPIEACMVMLKELYSQLPKEAFIANATVTGYGEGLIKAAFKVDLGEIETMAHYLSLIHI